MNNIIDVEYVLYTSNYSIKMQLPKLLKKHKMLSFDTETRSVYNKETRKEASDYLKDSSPSDDLYRQARVVAESSGLSFPSIVNTTHFIFGESRYKSHVIVCSDEKLELFIWNLVADYEGKLLVHNALFDLKIMYQRTKRMPKNYVDTSLLVKCLINHVNIWKCKTSLKELMGVYYSPKWLLMNDYEPVDLKNTKFLMYAAIDGSATYYLYELIQKQLEEEKNNEI